jgi:hypothetical protein
MTAEAKPAKAFNAVTVLIGLMLLAFWIYFAAVMTTTPQVRGAHQILMIGFGAIFTLFIVKLTCMEPAITVAGYVGLTAGALFYILVGPPQYPIAKVFYVLAPAAAAGVPLYYLFRKLMPRRLSLRGDELAVVYAIVVIGAATAMISRSTFMAAEGMWRDEYKVAKWIPPHFLPVPDARDDAANMALAAKAAQKAAPADAQAQSGTPSEEYVEKGAMKGLFEGRAKVPWFSWFVSGYGHGRDPRDWTFPGVFWIILILSVEFFFLFLVLIFRKRWIEEERYPFPLAQPPLSIIGDGGEDGSQSFFNKRVSWIAFSLGFALCLASVLSVSRANTKAIQPLDYLFFDAVPLKANLTGYKLVPELASIVWLSPFCLIFMLLFPVDVLMTMLLTFVLFGIIFQATFKQLATYVGVIPDWGHVMRGITVGGGAGLLFWTLVFQWREIERLLVGFARRTRSAVEGRFLNFRNALLVFWAVSMAWAVWVYPSIYGIDLQPSTRWLLLGGTFLMFLYVVLSARRERIDPDDSGPIGARSLFLLISAMGLTFVALTLPGRSIGLLVSGTIVLLVFAFASIRARAESPQGEWYEYDQGRLDASVQARFTPGPADPSLGITPGANHWWDTPPGVVSHFYGWELGAYYKRLAPHNSFLDTFKIGHETGASAKDILKAIVLAMVVAAVCTPVASLIISYTYGASGVNYPLYFYEDYISGTGHMYIFGTSSMEPPNHFDPIKSTIYSWPILFFFMMGVIMYMRREYVWFPFHPIGFLMGAWVYQPTGYDTDIWFTILLAFLAKRTIFRWFGVRYFRDKVQPVLVFAAMGMVLGMALFLLRFAVDLGIGRLRWS